MTKDMIEKIIQYQITILFFFWVVVRKGQTVSPLLPQIILRIELLPAKLLISEICDYK